MAQIPRFGFFAMVAFIGYWEYQRALFGWKEPKTGDDWWQLNPGYYPGDFGWDPAGVRPQNPADLEAMQTRELQHGRLAMLAVAGIVAQELTDGLGIVREPRARPAAAKQTHAPPPKAHPPPPPRPPLSLACAVRALHLRQQRGGQLRHRGRAHRHRARLRVLRPLCIIPRKPVAS